MGDKEPTIQLETHTIKIPHAQSIFGKMFEMPLECVFGYSGDLKNNHAIQVQSLTGVDSDGILFDMMYLVEDEGNSLTKHLIMGILNNHSAWDIETEAGEWWANHSKVPS